MNREQLVTASIITLNSSKEERVNELVKFWEKTGMEPIPIPKNNRIIFYRAEGGEAISSKILAMFTAMDVEVITGQIDFNKMPTDPDKFKPCQKSFMATFGGHKVQGDTIPYNVSYFGSFEERFQNAMGFVASHYVKELNKLTVPQQYEYLSLLCPSAKLEDEEMVINGMKLDLNSLTITSRVRRYAKPNIFFYGETIKSAGFLVFLMLSLTGQRNPNGYLNDLPNMWKRDPQYAVNHIGNPMWDKNPTKWMMDNSVQRMGVSSFPGFPFSKPINQAFDLSILRELLDSGEAVVTDKYAMKDVGGTEAAHAAGQGRHLFQENGYYVDEVITMHDCSKPSKFLNRVTQARRFLQAEVEGMQQSPFAVEIKKGEYLHQTGVRLRTCVAKTTLNYGSGPAAVRPNLKFETVVKKTGLKAKLVWLRFSKQMRDFFTKKGEEAGLGGKGKHAGMEYLKYRVTEQAQQLIDEGDTFFPHQVIMNIAYDSVKKQVLLKNNMLNQPIKLVGFDIFEDTPKEGQTSQWFEIDFTVELRDESPIKKFRNDFVKLTTLRQPMCWFDENMNQLHNWGGVDICLNNETVKGRSIEMAMFVIAFGGGYLQPSEGKLFLNKPEECPYLSDEERENGIDLLGEIDEKGKNILSNPTAIHRWVQDHKEVRYITVNMAKREWEYFSTCHDRSYFESVVDRGDYVEITEKIDCLIGDYFYAVELSTPLENTGRSSLTIQQLANIGVADKKLAEDIFAASKEYRDTTMSLVTMLTGADSKSLPLVNISRSKVRARLQKDIGSIDGLSDSAIISKFSSLFPNGIRLAATSSMTGADMVVVVNFDVLRTMTEFIGGAAKGISQSVCSLLHFVLTCESDSSIDGTIFGYVKLIKEALRSWFAAVQDSKALFKRVAQTAKVLVGGKVKTSYNPILNHQEDELPKVILHPGCDIVRELCKDEKGRIHPDYINEEGKFCPDALQGKIVGLMRTPMVMLGCFQVILHPHVGDIGHAQLLAYLWSQLTEGDSDGDGINLINLSSFGVDYERASKINGSVVSFRGYQFVYGPDSKDHPYAEFSNPEDCIKKGFDNQIPYMTRIPTGNYIEACEKIQYHYRSAVGIAYGIASVLSFKTLDLLYKFGEGSLEYKLQRSANVVTWRILYEGLGLSGWSANAERFFYLLGALTFTTKGSLTKDDEGNVSKFIPEYKCKNGELIEDVLPLLVELSELGYIPEGMPDKAEAARKAIFRRILDANKVRIGFGAITRNSNWKKYIKPEHKNEYSIFGALREASRGFDSVGSNSFHAMDEEMDGDETISESLFNIVLRKKLWENLSCQWLATALRESALVHDMMNHYKYTQEKMDEEGF